MIKNKIFLEERFIKKNENYFVYNGKTMPKSRQKRSVKILFISLTIGFLFLSFIFKLKGMPLFTNLFTIAFLIMLMISLYYQMKGNYFKNLIESLMLSSLRKLSNKQLYTETYEGYIQIGFQYRAETVIIPWDGLKSYFEDGDYLWLCSDEKGKRLEVPYDKRNFNEITSNKIMEMIQLRKLIRLEVEKTLEI